MKGLIVIAFKDFRDEEFFIPYQYFKENGIEITVVSSDTGTATGRFGKTFAVTRSITDVQASEFDFIFFVGGSGSISIRNNADALQLARAFAENGKITAAICLAPTILAKAKLLKGKNATVWPGEDPETSKDTFAILEDGGAKVLESDLVIDQNIITARDYQASLKLAKAIVNAF